MPFRFPIAAVLLISAAALAPQTVLGSCGDWLAHAGLEPENVLQFPADRDVENAGSSPSKPCNGPGCRQAPLAPLPVPSDSTTISKRVDLVCWADSSQVVSCLSERGVVEDRLVLARGYQLGIYRPPQS